MILTSINCFVITSKNPSAFCCQLAAKMCQTPIVFSPHFKRNKAVRFGSCHLLLLDNLRLSAANLATVTAVVGCCFRPTLSCSLRLTKYPTNHLITLLSVGAPVFHHVMIMVRLTSPRILQVEGYRLNFGLQWICAHIVSQTTGLVVATRLSEDPSASILVLEAGGHNLNDPEIGIMMLCFISSHPFIRCVQKSRPAIETKWVNLNTIGTSPR